MLGGRTDRAWKCVIGKPGGRCNAHLEEQLEDPEVSKQWMPCGIRAVILTQLTPVALLRVWH